MAKQHNWVGESVTGTPGTGTITLGGAFSGTIKFSDAYITGDTVHYSIKDGANREMGVGTLTTGTPWTLARTTVLETLVSGVYDDTSPTAITLTSAALVTVNSMAEAPGTIVGSAITTNSSHLTSIIAMPFDDTIPTNTEGDELFTVSYTPKYVNSDLKVTVQLASVNVDTNKVVCAGLYRDTGAADATSAVYTFGGRSYNNMFIQHIYSATATTSTTFKVRIGAQDTTQVSVNSDASARIFGGTMNSFIKVKEIRQ